MEIKCKNSNVWRKLTFTTKFEKNENFKLCLIEIDLYYWY